MLDLNSPLRVARPPIIEFGAGKAAALRHYAAAEGYSRVFVVADAFNANRINLLDLGCDVCVFAGVAGEPDLHTLESALSAARQYDPDLVVGFGGGSAMDVAKLVAVLAPTKQGACEVVGVDRVAARRIGLAQIPTTSGTGSEGGTRALVTDPETRDKLAIESRHMLADVVIIDPRLMKTIPARVTAETGIDALAHCVESYTSRIAHPIIDVYAFEGIRLIGQYLRRAVTNGADCEARAGMALAALYGGYCLGPVNTTGGHAVAYPLSTWHHLPHAAAVAVIFPHLLAFNAQARTDRTSQVLSALGLRVGRDSGHIFEVAHDFCQSLGIDMSISSRGVKRDQLRGMAEEAAKIRRLLDNNPRSISAVEIELIYQAAFTDRW